MKKLRVIFAIFAVIATLVGTMFMGGEIPYVTGVCWLVAGICYFTTAFLSFKNK